MTPETKALVVEHAKKECPRESCGVLLVRNGVEGYYPCRNMSAASGQFIMSPDDYAAAEEWGEVTAVVHSHCFTPPEPSQADRVACEMTELPWHIISVPNETWGYLEPCGYKAPLVGREFSYGVLDCYTLVRDWFRQERGVELMDFDRDQFDWWKKGKDFYMENFAKAGFRRVLTEAPQKESLEVGDCFLIQIGGPVPSHAAIYIGEDLMLHHLQNKLSSRDVYGGFWRKNTRAVVRYVGT